jgi:hypothetical protein
VISLLLVTLLTALITAHFMTVQKNSRQSNFINDLSEMRKLAESGINQSLYEISFGVGKGDGDIGTELWVLANDLGRDGKASTSDDGERDGMPTPGEPNVIPIYVGPPKETIGLYTHTSDSAWAGVKRVVSTAYNVNAMATVEAYVRVAPWYIPGVGAAYVQSGTVLDLNGNAFTISGTDVNPDGSPGTSTPVYGLVTDTGDPPGTNSSYLLDQVPLVQYDNIIGTGGSPSIGETSLMDLDGLINALKLSPKTTVDPGTYGNVTWGDYTANDFKVTYSSGDVTLSGKGKGAGALVVEGSLTLSGEFEFVGLVIVKGDLRISGGGGGVHIYGATLVGQSLTAIDPGGDVTLSGSADLVYSSWALGQVAALLPSTTTVLYWNDIR